MRRCLGHGSNPCTLALQQQQQQQPKAIQTPVMLTTFAGPLLLLLLTGPEAVAAQHGAADSSYFPDWGTVIGGRPAEPTCVDIPQDMALCSDIDYSKMRLPNLLDHETLTEAQKQANYWVPLLNLRCHPDTQLFLCSLFTPVCLETPIYPCRSLCETVRGGCEARMRQYSFPWPDMLRCEKFPEDNDMCIAPQNTGGNRVVPSGSHDAAYCSALCDPVDTLENILDHYCRADVVVKTRLKRQRKGALLGRKAKVYKAVGAGEQGRRSLRRSPMFSLSSSCCSVATGSSSKFLIMGSTHGQEVQTTFLMPFGKSRSMKKALRMFKSLNCSDPTLFTGKGDAHLSKEPGGGVIKPEQVTEDGKKKRKNKEKTIKDKKKRIRGKKKDQDVMSENQKKERNTDSRRKRGRKKSKESSENQNQDDQEKVNIPTEHYQVENSGIDMKTVEKMVEMGGVKLNKKNDNRKNKGNKRENGRKRERQGKKRKSERNKRRKEKEESIQIDLSEPDNLSPTNIDSVIEPSSQ